MTAKGSWLGALAGLALLGAGAGAGTGGAAAAEFRWAGVAEEVAGQLDQAVAANKAGTADRARQAVLTAYFGLFEDRKMEAAIRKELGQAHTVELEDRFNALRKAVGGGAAPEAVAAQAAELSAMLRKDAIALDALGVPEQVYVGR